MTTQVCFGKKVSLEFIAKVRKIAVNFGWNSEQRNFLMACMAFESAGSFSPSIRNAAGSGAVGLIQFMPSTAKELNTTVDDLSKMTSLQQLDYVEAYFKPYANKVKTLSDMYMAILLPKYVGKPETSILFSRGTVAYRQNSGLDVNTDGSITKFEATSKVQAMYEQGMREKFVLTLLQ